MTSLTRRREQMSHTIKTQHIAAAIHTSADLDVRYYLNGVFVDSRVIVSTDGHCASAYLGEECDEYLPPFIIPTDAAKLIGKLKCTYAAVTAMPDGRIDIGGVVFKPVDGTFPDYKRVFAGKAGAEAHNMQFSPDLIMKFQKVAQALKASCKVPYLYATEGGMGFRVAIQGKESEFMGVLMPFELKDKPFVCGDWL